MDAGISLPQLMVTKPWLLCSLTESPLRTTETQSMCSAGFGFSSVPLLVGSPGSAPARCPGNWPGSSLQRRQRDLSPISTAASPCYPKATPSPQRGQKRTEPGSCPSEPGLLALPAGFQCQAQVLPTKATVPCPFPAPEFPLGAKGESWDQRLGVGRNGGRAAQGAALGAGDGEKGIIA